MKIWCRWIAIGLLIVLAVAIWAWLPVRWYYNQTHYNIWYEVDHCKEMNYEVWNLTHVLDAMNQDLTREGRERVKADYIYGASRVLYEFILCQIQKDYFIK